MYTANRNPQGELKVKNAQAKTEEEVYKMCLRKDDRVTSGIQ